MTAHLVSDRPPIALEFPPWIVWGVRRGAKLMPPDGSGPTGRPRCMWCRTEVTGRRTTWCSDWCVRRYLTVFTWDALRTYIRQLAGYRCAICGALAGATGQVDHIVPVRNGGTDDPANLRHLCHACHVAVGYEQRAAEARAA